MDDSLVLVLPDYPSEPYEFSWDSTTVADGDHILKVKAYFDGGGFAEDEITVTVSNVPSEIMLNRSGLNYGAIAPGGSKEGGDAFMATGAQTLLINNNGGGTLNWELTTEGDWLVCTPSYGMGDGVVSVAIDPTGLEAGSYSGSITVWDPNSTNKSVEVPVNLKVYDSGATTAPFGTFETPYDGSTVRSSVPVTGWVLDDIETTRVKIYRDPVTGETGGMVYIGDAVLIDGARPDVEALYPDAPLNYEAGWGYTLLTYGLPNHGNGTYTLHAKAMDKEGNMQVLGSRTIVCDNDNAVKPFGAIDSPEQMGIASGSSYVNWGWALTPQPNMIPYDGSTITLWVDSIPKSCTPIYNLYRSDIATLFPGYANSDGAVGYFYLDTTAYENGVHTIAWSVTDNAGNTDGIGSRYFTIENAGSKNKLKTTPSISKPINLIPFQPGSPVTVTVGTGPDAQVVDSFTDASGAYKVNIKELDHLQIKVDKTNPVMAGYQVLKNGFAPLPMGSTLDNKTGVFNWAPGSGFVGNYKLLFVMKSGKDMFYKIIVDITIEAKH